MAESSVPLGRGISTGILSALATRQHPCLKIGLEEPPKPSLALAYRVGGQIPLPCPSGDGARVEAAQEGGGVYGVKVPTIFSCGG
jgi:hypothetical protein